MNSINFFVTENDFHVNILNDKAEVDKMSKILQRQNHSFLNDCLYK